MSVITNTNDDFSRSLENISTLWDQNPTSQSVVLVLPDALQAKYYLKDYHGKIRQEKARSEREMVRYQFLSRKIASSSLQLRKKQQEIVLTTSKNPATGTQSLIEKRLNENILQPLRTDEKLLEQFLSKVEIIKARRKEKPKKKLPRPSIILPQESRILFLKRERAKSDAAQTRRSTPQQPSIPEAIENEFDEDEAEAEPLFPLATNKDLMASKWLAVIRNIQRLRVLFKVLENHRRHVARYELQNLAIRVIQCRWRRVDMVSKMALVVRQAIAAGGRTQGRMILKHRQEALAIITSFLSTSGSGLQGLIRSFIRKVKRVQDICRVSLRANASRLSLLGLLFDRSLKILFSFVGLIAAGKLPKTLDTSHLNRLRQKNDPTVISDLISVEYFTKFNEYFTRNATIAKNWKQTRQDYITGKYELDHQLREKLLIDLLIKLRHRHVSWVVQRRVKKSDIPLVVEEEVRDFIRGGKDPLYEHMMKLDPIQSLLHQFQKEDMMATLRQQQRRNNFPPLLLLRTITTEDLYDVTRIYLERYCANKSKKEKIQQQQLQQQAQYLVQTESALLVEKKEIPVEVKRRFGTTMKGPIIPNTTLGGSGGGPGSGTSGAGGGTGGAGVMNERDKSEEEAIRPAVSTTLTPVPPPTSEKPSGSRKFRRIIGE